MRHHPYLRVVTISMAVCLVARAQTTGNTTAKLVGASTATAGSSAASASDTSAAPAVKKLNVRFQTIAMQNPVKGLEYKTANSTAQLMATPQQSRTYTYVGPATMEIYATGGSSKPVGAITFPKDGNYILYMFGDASSGVGGAAVTNDPRSFPAGSVRFINGTNYPLSLIINDKSTPLKPGDFLISTFKSSDDFTIYLRRTDKTDQDPLGEVDFRTTMSPPSSKVRDTEFIIVGNPMEVLKDGTQPNFNMVEHLDSMQNANNANRGGRGTSGTGGGGGG